MKRLLVYDTFEAHVTENAKVSSNSSQIDLSSLTLSVPWVVEELDAVDNEWYPWFYSGWPPQESIRRTDHFVAGASSDVIFWRDDPIVVFWVLPNHDVFALFFRNHFLCLLLPFFFFKVQSKIGVRIIHRRALYKGKYGKDILTPENGVLVSLLGRHWGSSKLSSLSRFHSSSITSFTMRDSSLLEFLLNRSTNFCLPFLSLSKHLYKSPKTPTFRIKVWVLLLEKYQ